MLVQEGTETHKYEYVHLRDEDYNNLLIAPIVSYRMLNREVIRNHRGIGP